MAHKGRLTTAEVTGVFNRGAIVHHRWFALRVVCEPAHGMDGGVRWGIAVGKRMAGSAVERNRLRRKVAEAIREVQAEGQAMVVVQLRREGAMAPPAELGRAIDGRLGKFLRDRCSPA